MNRFLASEGYTLVKGAVPNKSKTAHVVEKPVKNGDLKAWAERQAEEPKVEKVRRVKAKNPVLDEDEKPRGKKLTPDSKWPDATESGEAIKALITKHNLTDKQLMHDYELDEDEIQLLHHNRFPQIGRRILFETLKDMRTLLEVKEGAAEKPCKVNPNRELGGMTRSQMGQAIGKLLADNVWLTDDELIHNYEFGVNEVVWARKGDWLKFSGSELNSIYKDLTGGINERAIEIPTTSKQGE